MTTQNIADVTVSQLETMVIYGIATLILYIVGLVAITGYEIRQAKQAQGVTSVIPFIAKALIYIVAFELFVTLIYVVLVSASPRDFGNPAIGVYAFWHIEWLNSATMTSLAEGVIFTSGGDSALASAQTLVLVMMIGRVVYALLLMAMFTMVFSFAYSIPTQKRKQQNEDFDASFAGELFIVLGIAMLAMIMIFGITSSLLEGIIALADGLGKYTAPTPVDIDVYNDLAMFVTMGINEMNNAY